MLNFKSFQKNERTEGYYALLFKKNESLVGRMELGPKKIKGGLARYVVRMPESVYINKFDTIIIKPVYGDGHYSIGHFFLKNNP